MDFKAIVDSIPDAVIFERSEMVKLLEEVSKINPKVILEIGTNQGKSAMAFKRAFNPEMLITLDIATPQKFVSTIEDGITYLWEHDSLQDSTVEDVRKLLNGKKADFLWIDGEHYPENVESDYTKYSPFVRKGGIVGFHDIYANRSDIQVGPFWNKIKEGHTFIEHKTLEPLHLDFQTGFGLLYV